MALIKNPFDHDLTPADAPLVHVQLDGQWVEVPRGLNVIEVARRFGKLIPHYCYHPKLSIAGNCRMCLFEMGTPKLGPDRKPILDAEGRPVLQWMPRPQIACATTAFEGIGIRTNSPLVESCQEGVLEFLLLNHPLDCPICDQAGECKLQEYAFDYGKGRSRFGEEKVKKPKRVDIGPRILLDDERCILCTRCIRFARELAGEDCLGITERGGYNRLSVYPDKRFTSNYSLNTADICPVGALTTKDFRFRMRVWFLKETESICVDCATGCNVTVGSREGIVYRLTPRVNEAVNSHWMCDQGRLGFHPIHSKHRVLEPGRRADGRLFPGEWPLLLRQVAEALRKLDPSSLALLVSARMTNEELFLVRQLRDLLQGDGEIFTEVVPRKGKADGLLRSDDLNPNSRGARILGIGTDGERLPELRKGIEEGKIRALFCLHEDAAGAGVPEALLSGLVLLVWQGILADRSSEIAHWVLPGASFAEKNGTMVNRAGRLQRIQQAIPTPGRAKEDIRILRGLILALGGEDFGQSGPEVFAKMAARIPAFQGLSWVGVGNQGVTLPGEVQ
ncbi:NADH-quinone oxidoreductase subunit G [Methylacidimicrobium cyclopophantes]|uniref:NADH-quinone oxidoreductase subunit G n=1 Tax=Methylacidimicrobium cyclopophantes TaxID=1041766 RepID=A0A5E6M802_9BACT|nr:molybdopterin-dependent oxidoreductase [Methylacidimicrobium cyclopophantes]VVM05062.1 NADH-quinone oxidoreductase subunit G [Methylacidimicrobium cyclopophantes]